MMDNIWLKRHTKRREIVILIFALVSAALICSSCGISQDTSKSTSSFSPEIEQELEAVLDKVMTENGIPGALVYVHVPGEGTWLKAIGLADTEEEEAMDLADNVRIGSITKTFVATVVLQLVDDGKFGLDDTLDGFELQPVMPNSGEVTVRMLLNHTSGFFDYTSDESFQKQAENLFRKWAPQELIAFAASHDPYFASGEGWHYSNTNYILQGMIIEKVTGKPVGDEIQTRIADRLGLSKTTLPNGPEMNGEYSHGYMYADDSDELLDITEGFDPSLAWAAGAMISNLDDLKVWAKALADGDLLSDALQQERLQTVEAWYGSMYGLGIVNYEGFWGHPGDIPGFSSAMFYNPDKDAYIILSLNKNPNGIDFAGFETFRSLENVIYPTGSP